MSMNSIDLHNYLSLHRREVIRLIQGNELTLSEKMRLHAYVRSLQERLDEMSKRILIKFEHENQPAHNPIGGNQEPDCDTVGDYQRANRKGA